MDCVNSELREQQPEEEVKFGLQQIYENEEFAPQLVDLICALDDKTRNHVFNVARGCKLAGNWMMRYSNNGFNKEDTRLLVDAALMHDIGKIPLKELAQTGRSFTFEERLEMEKHPRKSANIVKNRAHLFGGDRRAENLAQIILMHHEVGLGDVRKYPRHEIVDIDINDERRKNNHSSEKIMEVASILAMVDRLSGQLEDRTYHKPLSKEQALLFAKKQFPDFGKLAEFLVANYSFGNFQIK